MKALGPAAARTLRRIVVDPAHRRVESANRNAPGNAAMVLAAFHRARSAPFLVDALAELPDTNWFIDMAIIRALCALGPSILEVTWAAYERTTENPAARRRILGVLAGLGVRDARIGAALAQDDMIHVHELAATYGDPALLPALRDAYMRDRENVPSPDPIGDDHLDYCNGLASIEDSIHSIEKENALPLSDLPAPRPW